MAIATRQRRDQIMAQLIAKRVVTASEVAGDLDVSEATVRRDLKALAGSGDVELIHGGAKLVSHADYSFSIRQQENAEAKRVIGRLAASLIRDNQQVFIDSGTTCLEVAPHLRHAIGVSVIANSARLARDLDNSGADVIMIGGKYRPQRMDSVGPIAMSTLERLRGYTAVIGADGLSMDFGPSANDIDSAHLYAQAVRGADQTILLADSSKFGSASLYRIVEWNQIDRIVTERQPDPEWTEFLSEHHIDIVCPESCEVGEPSPQPAE